MPSASASRRSLRIAFRLREARLHEKIVEARIAVVLPMELLVGPLQQAHLAGELPFAAREEGDMQGGDAEPVGHLHGGLEQQRFSLARVVAGADEEPLAGDRREGDRGLQLRIIAAAGAQIGVGPAMVEDIFALAVRFQIARHAGDQRSRRILEEKMLRQPAGLARGGAAVLQRAEKSMRDEWVIEPRRRGWVGLRAARAGIPVGRRHIGDARDGAQQDGLARVGGRSLFDIAHGG